MKAALVDLDGTLVDTLPDFLAALNATLGELGWGAVDHGFVARTVGKGSEHLIRSTLAHVGAPQAEYERAWAAYQRHYRVSNGRAATVYPGAAEGLQRLADAGWRLACVTNKPTDFARALLEATGLAHFFAFTFGGDAFARRKPDPLPLLRTCAALATAPAQTLVIGDSSNDAQAARAAGCPVILVSYGYNHGLPVADIDADAVVDRLDAIRL